jgi:hypothetical protein
LLENSDFAMGLSSWEHDARDQVRISIRQASEQSILRVFHTQRLDVMEGLYQVVTLAPDKVYVLKMDVKSTAATQILALNEGLIEDTKEHPALYEEWTTVRALFVTPHWPDGPQDVKVELYAARAPQSEIFLRNIQLTELQVALPESQ